MKFRRRTDAFWELVHNLNYKWRGDSQPIGGPSVDSIRSMLMLTNFNFRGRYIVQAIGDLDDERVNAVRKTCQRKVE